MASALINVPKKAKRGDVIEIKALMSHIMETGYRRTAAGDLVPRDIITNFACRYTGQEIFRADFFPAIAANPYLSFFTIAKESGKFEFEWIGDNGFSSTASASITVEEISSARYRWRRCSPAPSSLAKFRRRCAAPATPSWGPTPAPCRMTTPPIPAC